MPELPEVETVATDLRHSPILKSLISEVSIYWPPIFSSNTTFLKGKKILDVARRGKFLVFKLNENLTLLVHLRMSGRFLIKAVGDSVTKHEHVSIDFENGTSLRYHDTRKFGRFYLTENPDLILGNLGPEPFTLSLDEFKTRLLGHKRQLKPLLLDQSFIAGLGNIYADESLWGAALHPQRTADSLNVKECQNLHHAIQASLQKGLEFKGTSLGAGSPNFHSVNGTAGDHQNHLNVFHRQGKPCPRCQTAIKKITVAQRGTHFCPACQIS